MDYIEHTQGTQARIGDTHVGIMRVGDTGDGSVTQLMIRGADGDRTVIGYEGDTVDIPGEGAVVIGAASAPDAEHPRWRIALAHVP